MTTGEWFVLIPLNQGLFLNDLRIWRGDGRGVLIPLNQGLFLNCELSNSEIDRMCLNPFESGSIFKQQGAGFSFLINSLQSSFPIFFLSPKLSHFFTPTVLFIFCRRAYATPLVGGVNAPCPARRSFRRCRCGVYRLVMQVWLDRIALVPGQMTLSLQVIGCVHADGGDGGDSG